VEDFSNQLSSSLFVSSPRNTVGAFMTENRSHPLERAPAESLSLRFFIPDSFFGLQRGKEKGSPIKYR
jgi:hypothetical protein